MNRTDAAGRYCLNDLHKAAGGEKAHQPSNFFRLDSTNDLIGELDKSSDVRICATETTRGRNGGTYVAKELVYAYAMWVSPSFTQILGDSPTASTVRVADASAGLLRDTRFRRKDGGRKLPDFDFDRQQRKIFKSAS